MIVRGVLCDLVIVRGVADDLWGVACDKVIGVIR